MYLLKTIGFKEMWSARVFGNIPLSTTGQMVLGFYFM
jgi:hypothetical protein